MVAAANPLQAQLINLGPGSFTPLAPVITFSEPGYPNGTTNPVYNFTGLTGIGNETVSFAGAFMGQTVTGTSVKTLSGNPTGPLALNTSIPVFITGDGAVPTSPILSGTPTYNGPIVMLFSQAVAAVGLSGGYFDAVGGTTISAFNAAGALLGSLSNSQLGNEFFGLATASGANEIAGLAFYITGNEPAGFDIDNVTFGAATALVNPPTNTAPEPASIVLMATGLAGIVAFKRKRSRAS